MTYCETVFKALGGQVKNWITLNEPWVVSFNGHYWGNFAPGLRDFSAALAAGHNLLRAHGLAVRSFRQLGLDGEIGIVLNLCPREPASDMPEDISAAVRNDGFGNRWFLDPLFKSSYPLDMGSYYASKGIVVPRVSNEDMKLIGEKIDFLGVNYYYIDFTKAKSDNWPLGYETIPGPYPVTLYGWPVVERGLTDLLIRLKLDYDLPKLYVTENGASYPDVINIKGEILDDIRIDYLERHILACYKAIEAGVPLSGYFVWSLIDNFEWSTGFKNTFGLIYLNKQTQGRIIKRSGIWYSNIIRQNGIFSN
jgi:beta-glucosidase